MATLYQAKEVWTGTLASAIPDGTTTSFTLTSSSGLINGKRYLFTIDRVDASGTKTPSKKEVIAGTVSGSNVIDCIRGVEGTAQAHSSGAIVEVLFNAKHWNELVDYLETEHNTDGTHKSTLVTTLKATGSSINAGLEDDRIVTPKAIADSNIVFTDKTQTLTNKTLTSPLFQGSLDGWIYANETWTYASSTTFTISGDKTGKYQKGDKIRLKQGGGYKYFYITNVSYSNPNTTVTITGGNDYSLANAAITDNYYSKVTNPIGFPIFFKLTSSQISFDTSTIDNNAGGQPPLDKCYFKIDGNYLTLFVSLAGGAYKNGNGTFIKMNFPPITLPSPDSNYIANHHTLGFGRFQNGSDKGITVRNQGDYNSIYCWTTDTSSIANDTPLSSTGFYVFYIF